MKGGVSVPHVTVAPHPIVSGHPVEVAPHAVETPHITETPSEHGVVHTPVYVPHPVVVIPSTGQTPYPVVRSLPGDKDVGFYVVLTLLCAAFVVYIFWLAFPRKS